MPSIPSPPAWQREAQYPWGWLLWPVLVLLMALMALVFRFLGEARPWAQVDAVDVLGEGGMVAMAGLWLHLIASGRPAGRVSNWLVLGMAGLGLGFWTDLLDEAYRLPKAMLWDNALESGLMLGGMLAFTRGLALWREEQRALQTRLIKRKRLFREHRGYDGVTQLADADYMARHIELERQRLAAARPAPGGGSALLMLAVGGHADRVRSQGLAEAERTLQAVSLLLLLNLPPDSLLCRHAGEHFCVLLPDCTADRAQQRLAQLCAAVAHMSHHRLDGQTEPVQLYGAHRTLHAGDRQAAPTLLRDLQQAVPSPRTR